jgi:hypothetical protein
MKSTNEFIDFLLMRQKLYMAKTAGKPWPFIYPIDPVMARSKVNNIFRAQDKFTEFELSEIRNHRFAEQLMRILIMRQTITKPIYIKVKEKNFKAITKKELTEIRDEVGSGNEYISVAIQFYTPKGLRREDVVIDHIKTVLKDYKKAAAEILKCDSPTEVINVIIKYFKHLGEFKRYEVYTSLTYCADFPFTENDFLHIGPGSKKQLTEYFDTKEEINLEFLQKKAVEISKTLKKHGFNFNGHEYTVRALEDSFCEFRKYINVKRGEGKAHRLFYPPIYPQYLLQARTNKTAHLFPPAVTAKRFRVDLTMGPKTLSAQKRLSVYHLANTKSREVIDLLNDKETIERSEITQRAKDKNIQSAVSNLMPCLVDVGFLVPLLD